jgi:hypothetical protein
MDTRCLLATALFAGAALAASGAAARGEPPLPARLQDTGIDHRDTLAFTPQYALWSDGAAKRRWLRLPRGAAIDGSDPDAWVFPPGTRLWKEFALDGRKLETRFIERLADGRWRFAAYVWSADGREARLAPADGAVLLGVDGARDGRWDVPSRADCLVCHGSAAVPVLGVSALQLSPDRDPDAPLAQFAPRAEAAHGVDLPALIARGLLRQYRATAAPRIPAASAQERAALGVLHANCGHCHNDSAQRVPVPLRLAQSAAATDADSTDLLRALVERPSRRDALPVVAPGRPDDSLLVQRMASRDPRIQMPPLGTRIPDADGLVLVRRWISHRTHQEHKP